MHEKFFIQIINNMFPLLSTDSQKLDSCSEGGLNLIRKNNNNNSNNNRNRTTSNNSSNFSNNNEPSDLDDGKVTIKNERIARSSSRSQNEDEKLENDTENVEEEFEETDNNEDDENDNNNNEDDEREEGEIKEDDEKSKLYKKKKRRRRKRELTLKTDQNQQIEDDDDETGIKSSPRYDRDHDRHTADDNIDGNVSDSCLSNNNTIRKNSLTRRRHSSSSDPVNLSIGNKQQNQDDSDDANIDVETISNAPTKVSIISIRKECSAV
jgi:hypothetical protein